MTSDLLECTGARPRSTWEATRTHPLSWDIQILTISFPASYYLILYLFFIQVRMLADKYQHIQLERECDRFINKIIHHDDTDTIVGWLVSNANLGEKLEQRCLNKLQTEFIKLMTSEMSRGLLHLDLLIKIIDSSKVLIHNELMLFNLVASWIMEKRHPSSQKNAVNKLLPLIRFSHMTIKELAEVEKTPVGIKYPDLIIKFMFDAYKSRARHAVKSEKDNEELSESIPPRMYTDEPWGAGYTKDSDAFLSSEFDFLNFKCPIIDRAVKPCLIKSMTDTWTVSYKKEIKSYTESEDQVINKKLVTHDLTFKFKFGERLRKYEIVIITGYIPKNCTDGLMAFQMLTTKKHYGTVKPIGTRTQSRRKIRLTEVLKPALLAGSEYVMSLAVFMQE